MGLETYIERNRKIEVTIWESDDDEGVSFSSSILDFRNNRIFIDQPRGQDVTIASKIKMGYLVGVVLPTENNLVMFYPLVASDPLQSNTGIILSISPETQFEVIQRRRYIRVPCTLPLKLELLQDGKVVHQMNARTVNISAGGMKISSAILFENEQTLWVYLRLSDLRAYESTPQEREASGEDSMLKLAAKVVFSQNIQYPKNAEDKYMAGLCFTNLSENQEAMLMRECFRRELTLKRTKMS